MASFKIFVLILAIYTIVIQLVRSVENPKIQKCFSNESDLTDENNCTFEYLRVSEILQDFQNRSTNIINVRNVSADAEYLHLKCIAAYPIQWLTHKPVGSIKYTKYEYQNESAAAEYIQHIRVSLQSNFSRKLRCERFGKFDYAVEIFLNSPEPEANASALVFETAGSAYFLGSTELGKSIIPCAAKTISNNNYSAALTKRNTDSEIFSTKCAICTCFGSSECPNNTFPCFSSNVCGSLAMSIWDNDTHPIDDYVSIRMIIWYKVGMEAMLELIADVLEYLECIRNFGCITCTIRSHMRKFPFEGKDCDGDGVLTCHDYARTYLLGEENCNKDLQPQQKDIFERFENCYNEAQENYTIIPKPEYDPTVGFRINENIDFELMYECSSNLHNVFYITPLSKDWETTAKIRINPPNPTITDTVRISCKTSRTVHNLNLQIASCNSISECDFKFQSVKPYITFIEESTDPELEQHFFVNETNEVTSQFSHGFVQCSSLYRPKDKHNVFGYAYESAYLYKRLDGGTRLLTKDQVVPNSGVISIQHEDDRELIEHEMHRFVCTISTFVLIQHVRFEVKIKGEEVRSRLTSGKSDGHFDKNQLIQTFILAVNLTKQMEEIFCLAPTIMQSGDFAEAKLIFKVNDPPLSILIILGIVGAIILFLAMAVSIIVFWRKYIKSKARLRNLTKSEVDAFFDGDKNQSDIEALGFSSEKCIPSDKLITYGEDKLGEGEFGLVCKGTLDGQSVAVKSTKPKTDVEYFKRFLTEIKVNNYIGHHENVVKFYGAVVDKIQERICFGVFELSPFGNLNGYLKKYEDNYIGDKAMKVQLKKIPQDRFDDEPHVELTESILISFCKQIASGMAYLAEKKVIHGDLATRNVLVFPNNVVKVTDFGLSRKLYECPNYIKSKEAEAPLPWRWMALESLKNMEYSSQSDVWSLAVTAWEIFSFSQVPFSGLTWSPEFVDEIEGGLRLAKPQQALVEIYHWMLSCWENEPGQRPTLAACKGFFINLLSKAGRGISNFEINDYD